MKKKYVYLFEEGNANMSELLGRKGANLAEMTNLNLPIPQGFTITTEACNEYYNNGKELPMEIQAQIIAALKKIEKTQNKKLEDSNNPLLLSIRSGAKTSMPGMMDTILNLGINDMSVQGLARKTNNPRFAYDSYRRFIQMYSNTVMKIPKEYFEKEAEKLKKEKCIVYDTELGAEDLKELVERYKNVYKEKTMECDFPQKPLAQLIKAIKAIFISWDNPRATTYRKLKNIPGELGTAVNIQTMVFGNMGETSGTGVAFTRNPSTGKKELYGEYLTNAQGEDIVTGSRTPQSISKLAEYLPECYNEFINISNSLEKHFRDMQDIEFTIQEGKLYILQTRTGKRTLAAATRIACDLANEGIINEKEAILRISKDLLEKPKKLTFDAKKIKTGKIIGQALPAAPGFVTGKVVFTIEEAKRLGKGGKGENIILVRSETTPEDMEGIMASQGVLTKYGGITSHASVVARDIGICCISGCEELIIDEKLRKFKLGEYNFYEGDYISLDGTNGKIYTYNKRE